MGIKLEERRVGKQWLITSPDLPGLYVADVDLETARAAVPSAIEMLTDMEKRRLERQRFDALAKVS